MDRFGAFVAIAPDAAAGTGPLSALRVAVKDNIAVRGLPFTAGHPLFADRIAHEDAWAVQRLRQAGARIVGVTRTDAGGFGVTTPEVENPVAGGRTVGGSSGGSAAAVAAGLADVALGTDTGGSVRIPAACTGLIGFKPTRGRIANDGVWPLSPSLDHVGVIGRDLNLVARTAEALLGPDHAAPLGRLRVGIDRAWLAACDQTVATAFLEVVDALQHRGIAIRPITLPDLDGLLTAHGTILLAEAREVYRSLDIERLAARAQRSLKAAEALTPETLAAARRLAARASSAIDALFDVKAPFDVIDVILSPTIPCPVPAREARSVQINGHKVPAVNALISNTAPFNLSGHPVLALPSNIVVQGIPFSIQLAGRSAADLSLFDAVRAIAPVLSFSASARA
jgi:Asp-tRNA(Asn)/Glu-tRNA(Gln) amidotransferase A subunit family amidase